MSCEGACAHAHVRCVVTRARLRAKSILESVRDVRACGSFLGVRCAIALLHTFWNKTTTIFIHLIDLVIFKSFYF